MKRIGDFDSLDDFGIIPRVNGSGVRYVSSDACEDRKPKSNSVDGYVTTHFETDSISTKYETLESILSGGTYSISLDSNVVNDQAEIVLNTDDPESLAKLGSVYSIISYSINNIRNNYPNGFYVGYPDINDNVITFSASGTTWYGNDPRYIENLTRYQVVQIGGEPVGAWLTESDTITGLTYEMTGLSTNTYIARVAGIDVFDQQGDWSDESDPYTPQLAMYGTLDPGNPEVVTLNISWTTPIGGNTPVRYILQLASGVDDYIEEDFNITGWSYSANVYTLELDSIPLTGSYYYVVKPSDSLVFEYTSTLSQYEKDLLFPTVLRETYFPRHALVTSNILFDTQDYEDFIEAELNIGLASDNDSTDLLWSQYYPEGQKLLDNDAQTMRKLILTYAMTFDSIFRYQDQLKYSQTIGYDLFNHVPRNLVHLIADQWSARTYVASGAGRCVFPDCESDRGGCCDCAIRPAAVGGAPGGRCAGTQSAGTCA